MQYFFQDPTGIITAIIGHPKKSELDKMPPLLADSTVNHPLENRHRIFLAQKSDHAPSST